MKKDLVIAGVGGQGNLFASKVIFHFALNLGLNVLGTETIGAAQRGGSVVSHIRISDRPIYSPLVPYGSADVLLGFEPLEMLRHLQRLDLRGKYLLNMYKIPTVMCNMGIDLYPSDEEIESNLEHSGVEGYILLATQRAHELGNALLMNVVMLGALSALDSFFVTQELLAVLEGIAQRKSLELNKVAFNDGYSLIKNPGFKSSTRR